MYKCKLEQFYVNIVVNKNVDRIIPIQEMFYFFTEEDELRIIENEPSIKTIMENIDKIKIQDQVVDIVI